MENAQKKSKRLFSLLLALCMLVMCIYAVGEESGTEPARAGAPVVEEQEKAPSAGTGEPLQPPASPPASTTVEPPPPAAAPGGQSPAATPAKASDSHQETPPESPPSAGTGAPEKQPSAPAAEPADQPAGTSSEPPNPPTEPTVTPAESAGEPAKPAADPVVTPTEPTERTEGSTQSTEGPTVTPSEPTADPTLQPPAASPADQTETPPPAPQEARWFSVIFLDWNGAVYTIVEIVEGSPVLQPSGTPLREGYRFEGWVWKDEEGEHAFAFGTPAGGSATEIRLYAKYAQVEVSQPDLEAEGALPPQEDAELLLTVEEDEKQEVVLPPERSVSISSSLQGLKEVPAGTLMVLRSELVGFEGVDVTYQWQCKASGSAWENVNGATRATLSVELDGSNDDYSWRVNVTPVESAPQ